MKQNALKMIHFKWEKPFSPTLPPNYTTGYFPDILGVFPKVTHLFIVKRHTYPTTQTPLSSTLLPTQWPFGVITFRSNSVHRSNNLSVIVCWPFSEQRCFQYIIRSKQTAVQKDINEGMTHKDLPKADASWTKWPCLYSDSWAAFQACGRFYRCFPWLGNHAMNQTGATNRIGAETEIFKKFCFCFLLVFILF